MRKMKKILLVSFLVTIALIGNTLKVSAFAVGDTFSFNSPTSAGYSPALYIYNPKKQQNNYYKYYDQIYSATYSKDGKSYYIYCMDPGAGTPDALVVKRLLVGNDGLAARDYGLAKVIMTEASDGSFQTSGNNFLTAKGLALRILLNGEYGWSNDNSRVNAIEGFKKIASDWKSGPSSSAIGGANGGAGPTSIIADAYTLYKIGIDATASYSASKSLDIKTEIIEVPDSTDNGGYVDDPTSEDNEDNTSSFTFGGSGTGNNSTPEQTGPIVKEINKKMIIKVSLSNFNKDSGAFKFDSFEAGTAGNVTTTIKGISTENSMDFESYTTPISYGTNVFETFSDKVVDNGDGTKNLELYVAVETSGTIEFDISAEGSDEAVCDESCSETNGKLNYTYTDPKVLTGAVLYDKNYATVSGAQRFLVADESDGENSEAIEIPIAACANACAEPDDPCTPVLCEGEDCEYNSTLPQLCSDDAELDEDGLVEYKFIEAYTEDGYNIVKCLLNAEKDAADNPYKLEDADNAKVVVDNPYCSILCKEDYSIRLPYKQVTDEGRYFKITLSMKGQQDCYSTKFNETKFNEDIIAKEKEVIDAINEWNVYYELVHKDANTLQKDDSNYEGCDRAKCSPDTGAKSGCYKEATESSPSTEIDQWFVRKGKMIWGQNPNVTYYTIDTSTGAISTIATPSELPDNVIVDYGYIDKQTYPESTCNFKDTNTKKTITGSYSTGFGSVGGVSLELRKNGSSIEWRLDNSDGDEGTGYESFMVRGYNNKGELLFQKRLTASAGANKKGTGSITGDSSVSKITILGYGNDEEYQNISCSATQEPCPKVEAEEHFEDERPRYESELERAKQEVETKVEELKEIIDQYNSCVGDKEYEALSEGYNGNAFWKMIYKYDPEIKYSYDEPDPTDTSRSKWIDEVQSLTCEDGTCDIMYAKNEKITAEDCAEDGTVECNELGAEGTFKSVFFESTNGSPDGADDTYVNTYCIGGVNDDYSCSDETLHTLGDTAYEDKPFFMCKFENEKFTCEEEEHPLTKVSYVHKAAGASGDYDTRLVYYTGHDDGDIKIRYSEQPILNYSQVPGLPVSADTPQGTYVYILNIENVGTFYNSGALGRIYGSDPKSLATYARGFQDSPTASYPITSGVGSTATDLSKEINVNEYACTYTVSQSSCTDPEGNTHTIDECDFGGAHANWAECQKDICSASSNPGSYCVKEAESYYICNGTAYDKDSCRKVGSRAEALSSATYNYNCCPECQVVCVGKCLYVVSNDKPKDGTLQYDFRTVSPQNMNPNSRKLGYNWDSANASNSLSAQKASNTIAEIEARAGAGQNPNINIAEIAEYSLKVTMTPDMVTWIKEYNNEQATQGAYNNDSLTCYSYDLDGYNEDQCKSSGYIWQEEKCAMSNVFCYSSFIDDLEGQFPQQVDAPHRSEAKNSAYDNFRTYTGLANQGQSIVTNDYWTIYKYDNLDINGDGTPDIGPSWK